MTIDIALSPGSSISVDGKLTTFNAIQKYPGHQLVQFSRQFFTPEGVATVEFSPVYLAPQGLAVPPVPVSKQIFYDDFTHGENWNTTWTDVWFKSGAVQNGVPMLPANVLIGNGVATLRATPSAGATMTTNPQGGANPGFSMGYGYVEVEAMFDGLGWGAIWLDGFTWPGTGENDIAEFLKGEGLTANYHSSQPSSGGKDVPQGSGPIPGQWLNGRHRFGLLREPGKSTWYWDGQAVWSCPTFDGGAPQYIILMNGQASASLSTLNVYLVRAWSL